MSVPHHENLKPKSGSGVGVWRLNRPMTVWRLNRSITGTYRKKIRTIVRTQIQIHNINIPVIERFSRQTPASEVPLPLTPLPDFGFKFLLRRRAFIRTTKDLQKVRYPISIRSSPLPLAHSRSCCRRAAPISHNRLCEASVRPSCMRRQCTKHNGFPYAPSAISMRCLTSSVSQECQQARKLAVALDLNLL